MSTIIKEKNKYSRAYVEEIREKVRPIIENVIKPNSLREGSEEQFPLENLRALGKEGWGSVLYPEELGGLDLGILGVSVVAEELGKVDASTGLIYAMHISASEYIYLAGNEDQKKRWLLPIREKGIFTTYSASEYATRGHVWNNLSQAIKDGDEYILDFEKSFTTSSGFADFYVVQTRAAKEDSTDPTARSLFLVDGKDDRITGKPWNALGLRGNKSGPIKYDNVRVHQQDLLTTITGNGFKLAGGFQGLNAVWLGVAQAALDAAVNHVLKTTHEDSNRNLADYQVLRHQLAEIQIDITGLRAWLYDLSRQFDDLEGNVLESLDSLYDELVQLKVQVTEVANKAAGVAMDIAGGYGYKEGIFERLYRDARGGLAMVPSNHVARDQISRTIVGLEQEFFTTVK